MTGHSVEATEETAVQRDVWRCYPLVSPGDSGGLEFIEIRRPNGGLVAIVYASQHIEADAKLIASAPALSEELDKAREARSGSVRGLQTEINSLLDQLDKARKEEADLRAEVERLNHALFHELDKARPS